jgi:hypothetical protein
MTTKTTPATQMTTERLLLRTKGNSALHQAPFTSHNNVSSHVHIPYNVSSSIKHSLAMYKVNKYKI